MQSNLQIEYNAKIPMAFLKKQKNPKICIKPHRALIAKAILRKSKAKPIMLSNNQALFQGHSNHNVWHWQKNRHTDRWDRKESAE